LQKILAEITDKDLRASARLINEYINIKTDRIEVYKKLQANFRIFFEKLVELWSEQRPALQYDDCISMIDEEIIAALRGNLAINPGLLKKRFRQDFVSIYQDDRLHFVYDKSLIKKIRNIFLSVKNSEVSGLVVSKGRVKGLARLIKSKADFSKFKAGEILVCNFTTPDYIPLMNKAAGIITDDGGITCHAAIISRELNKPCIVGTKSATRTIKTGDLLDLDADQGIIKILSA